MTAYQERVEREDEEDRQRGLPPHYERLWRMGYRWPTYIGGTSLIAASPCNTTTGGQEADEVK